VTAPTAEWFLVQHSVGPKLGGLRNRTSPGSGYAEPPVARSSGLVTSRYHGKPCTRRYSYSREKLRLDSNVTHDFNTPTAFYTSAKLLRVEETWLVLAEWIITALHL